MTVRRRIRRLRLWVLFRLRVAEQWVRLQLALWRQRRAVRRARASRVRPSSPYGNWMSVQNRKGMR